MNFGQAIDALKAGKRVTRAGWNGRGMFLILAKIKNMPRPFHPARVTRLPALRASIACPKFIRISS